MISSKYFFGVMLLLVGASMKGMFSSGMPISSLDDEQKRGLEEFRDLATMNLDLPQEYMKDDAYLLRYLSDRNFNLIAAFETLKRILAERESLKIDSILEENWSEYNKRFPYSISSVTKDGRPVLYFPYGKVDISEEIASGNFEMHKRFALKGLEEIDRKVDSMRKENPAVGQFDLIVDLKGYTLGTHGCFSCIRFYRDLVLSADSLYREAFKNFYIINAPSVFEAIYPYVSNFVEEEKTKVLGGRDSYEPVLLQTIDLDQFPEELLE